MDKDMKEEQWEKTKKGGRKGSLKELAREREEETTADDERDSRSGGYRGEPAVARENNCLNAAKACNLNDTCKKYRSAYISPCTSRVSTAEVCNKRKCHKALRQFFDKARHF
ncbi:hypothetical protein FQN60_014666 [Etheostoma spectabile]|uniref:GDNF/GAS1 domain-containing protein n=1 Tax=Etheostoma spectabile TaxID=54343 RepID=A0A5J5CN18_9PERO|nr:hypothetical protein FQN60_014666 [Etheostoma spectabile]